MTTCSMLCAVFFAFQPGSVLLQTADALEAARPALQPMRPAVEDVAQRIIGGGRLYTAGEPALVSEMTGRAGGLMLNLPLGEALPTAADAVLYFADADHPLPEALARSGASIVQFGGAGEALAGVHTVTLPEEAPLLSPTLENTLLGWLFTAELVGACTRAEKMPVIYESVGLGSGFPRIRKYQEQGILFHSDRTVARQTVGKAGEAYINAVSAMLRRCEKENRPALDRAGQWIATALRNGGRPRVYTMGHLFPRALERIPLADRLQLGDWIAGFSDAVPPKDTFGKGEVVVHLGYQHPATAMLQRAKAAGARAVYIAVRPDRDFPSGPTCIWMDPMWPFEDACVYLPGYDIPLLPASGLVSLALAEELLRTAAGQ